MLFSQQRTTLVVINIEDSYCLLYEGKKKEIEESQNKWHKSLASIESEMLILLNFQ